jgi:acetyl esterase/lipase
MVPTFASSPTMTREPKAPQRLPVNSSVTSQTSDIKPRRLAAALAPITVSAAVPRKAPLVITKTAVVTADALSPKPAATPVVAKPTGAATVVGNTLSAVLHAVLGSPTATTSPTAPAQAPALWTLLAFARREFAQASPGFAASGDVSTTTNTLISDKLIAAGTAVSPPPSVQVQPVYTGQPSFVARVVVAGLHLVDLALRPFGGLLAFTSLKVPLFTDGIPPRFLTRGLNVQRSEYDGMPVWTLQTPSPSDKYVVALHGGAYVAQVSLFHWGTYANLARDTGATVVVPLYPLAPKGTAGIVVPETADFISELIDEHGAENVSVLGDSAGGAIALAAVQELVRRGALTPGCMVLLAPWIDATVSDPASKTIDPKDPLLDVRHLRKDGQLWAGGLDPMDPLVSPLFGSLEGLPPTAVFSGSLDLLSPETLDLQQRVNVQGLTNFTFILRNGLIHDWPIFGFLPDAVAVRPEIYQNLLGSASLAGVSPTGKAT